MKTIIANKNVVKKVAPKEGKTIQKCAGPLVVVERFTAAERQLRSPPLVTAA